MILKIVRYFSAAHHLEGYKGDCSRVHGHTWKVIVSFDFNYLDELGLAKDFRYLKKIIDDILPDHEDLNKIYSFNPTAENIALKLYSDISECSHVKVKNIEVWESDNAGVVYEG